MKVALHAHSTWSYDGQWRLEQIARLFGAVGIDAVMMTEHDTGFDPNRFDDYRAACAAASTRRCRLIPGIEYSCPENDVHILTWGLRDFLTEHRPVVETLERVRELGGVAVFAHPVRRGAWQLFDPNWVPLLSGIELWNRKSDGISWSPWARDLLAETGLAATVGMDFHRSRQFYPLINHVDIPADADPETALVAALRDGRQVPTAFGRPILDADGRPQEFPHKTLERLRRGTLGRLRRHSP